MNDGLKKTTLEREDLPCASKLSFDNRLQADATASVVRYRYGTVVVPYICRDCQLWHLASVVGD